MEKVKLLLIKIDWVAEAGNYKELNSVFSKIKKDELNLDLRNRIKSTAINNFDFDTQLDGLEKNFNRLFLLLLLHSKKS